MASRDPTATMATVNGTVDLVRQVVNILRWDVAPVADVARPTLPTNTGSTRVSSSGATQASAAVQEHRRLFSRQSVNTFLIHFAY